MIIILNVASVAMLASVALLSYQVFRGRSSRFFGRASIVVLALMACSRAPQASSQIAHAPIQNIAAEDRKVFDDIYSRFVALKKKRLSLSE